MSKEEVVKDNLTEVNKAYYRKEALDSALSYVMRYNSKDDEILDHTKVLSMAKDFSKFLIDGEVTESK